MEDLSLEVEFLINSPAVKAAAEAVKNDIRGINQVAETEAAKVRKQFNKPIFSDSKKEFDDYRKSLEGLGGTRVATNGQAEFVKLLNQDLKAGIITAQQYEVELARLAALNKAGATTRKGPDQLGVIEKLKAKLAELNTAQEKTTDTRKLVVYNAKIESISAEIKRLTNAGKVGFDDMGNALSRSLDKPIGKLERLKYAANLYKNASATATNPDLISKYNKKLQDTQLEIGRIGNVGKDGFDKLGNAIKGSTNIAGKAFSALRTAAQVLPGIGIAGILAFAVEPIMKYLMSLDLFSKKITQLVQTRKMLAEVELKGAQAAVAEVTSLKLLYATYQNVNIPLNKRKEAYEQIQKLYPAYFGNMKFEETASRATKTAYDDLTVAIIATAKARAAADKITENTTRQLDNEAKGNDARAEQLKLEKEITAAKAARFTGKGVIGGGVAAGTGDSDTANSAKLESLERERNKQIKIQNNLKTDSGILTKRNLDLEKKVFEQVQKGGKLSGSVGGDKPKDTTAKDEAQLRAAEALQQKISDIENEYTRKSMNKDEAEIQAVRDKFKKLSDEVAKFNANKKNIIKVDGSGLERVKEKAIADLTFQQDTAKMGIELTKQKQLYTDYETFKTTFGEQKAKERFKSEIDTTQTYLDKLQAAYALTLSQGMTGGFSASLQERLTLLDTEAKKEQEVQVKKQEALLADFMTYTEKRKVLQETYLAKAAELRKAGRDQEAQEAITEGAKQVSDLDDQNVQKLSSYKKLFTGVANLSTQEAKRVVASATAMLKDLVAKGLIGSELAAKVFEKLNETGDEIGNRLPEGLSKMANELNNIAGIVGEVNQGFALILGTVANVSGQLSNVFRSANEFKKAQSTGDKITAGAGIISAGFAIMQTVNNFLDRETRADKQRAESKEKELKQTEALTRALERQLAVADKAYGTQKITEYKKAILDAQKAIDDSSASLSKRYALTGDKELDALIAKVNNGEKLKKFALWGETEKEMFELEKKYLKGINVEAGELQRLLDNGLLDASTAKLAENFLKAKEAIEDAKNSIAEFNTGTSFASLADGIVDLFAKGNAAAEDFGNNFEEIIKKAILNSFKTQSLAKQLQDFYNQFAELSSTGGQLTADEIAKLKAEYDKIITESQAKFNELEKVTGVSFKPKDGDDTSKPTATGAIKLITTEQAGILVGQFGGQRLATLEGNNIARGNGQTMQEQLFTMRNQLMVLAKIETNTKAAADASEAAIPYLKGIEGKVGDSFNLQLRAAGKFGY